MLPVWAIRRSLTIRSIRVVTAETDVLFLPVIGVMTDRLAAGLLIRQWWERMSEQRHHSPQALGAGAFPPNLLIELHIKSVWHLCCDYLKHTLTSIGPPPTLRFLPYHANEVG